VGVALSVWAADAVGDDAGCHGGDEADREDGSFQPQPRRIDVSSLCRSVGTASPSELHQPLEAARCAREALGNRCQSWG
jgi:hypothetical protein